MWRGIKFEFLEDGGVIIIKRWTGLNLEPVENVIRLTAGELTELFNSYNNNFFCREERR